MGASAALLGVSAEANKVFGYSRQGNPIVENPNQYGGYLVEQLMNQRGDAPYRVRDWMKPYAGDNPNKPAVEIPEGPMFPPKDPEERRNHNNMARRLTKTAEPGRYRTFRESISHSKNRRGGETTNWRETYPGRWKTTIPGSRKSWSSVGRTLLISSSESATFSGPR